jgi:hypothetical protein
MLVAEELTLGDPNDPDNVFWWSSIRKNYPGTDSYDPTTAWLSKVREDGEVAADLFTYVDDQRCTGPSEMECWDACRKIGSTNTYLGIQDASRKRREPSQTPGAWSGSVIRTDDGVVGVLVSQDKWEKGQRLADELWEMAEGYANEGALLDRKRLESIRGFLLYLTRTYPNMTPHLKGLHLSIDGWLAVRKGRGRLATAGEGAQ